MSDITFVVKDLNSEVVEGAYVVIEGIGSDTTNEYGVAVIPIDSPDTYFYKIYLYNKLAFIGSVAVYAQLSSYCLWDILGFGSDKWSILSSANWDTLSCPDIIESTEIEVTLHDKGYISIVNKNGDYITGVNYTITDLETDTVILSGVSYGIINDDALFGKLIRVELDHPNYIPITTDIDLITKNAEVLTLYHYDIEVTVIDENGNRLSDAFVKHGNYTQRTNVLGKTVIKSRDTSAEITITKDGYKTKTTVTESQSTIGVHAPWNLLGKQQGWGGQYNRDQLIWGTHDEELAGLYRYYTDGINIYDQKPFWNLLDRENEWGGQYVLDYFAWGTADRDKHFDTFAISHDIVNPYTVIESSFIILQKYHSATITIKDMFGNNIVNASITVNGVTKVTNNLGYVVFSDLVSDTYTCDITYGIFFQSNVIVVDGENLYQTIILTANKVKFIVTDNEGYPVWQSVVRITTHGLSAMTDKNGEAIFLLPDGIINYDVNRSNYTEVVNDVNVLDDTNVYITLDTNLTRFRILSPDDEPLYNTKVIYALDEAYTDVNGVAFFDNKAAGSHSYEIDNEGYLLKIGDVTATGGADTFTFNLEKAHTLSFRVRNSSGVILTGVSVELVDVDTKYTDQHGWVTFERLEPIEYNYTITLADYVSQSDTVTLIESHTIVSIYLNELGDNLVFIVQDEYNIPLEGVEVFVYGLGIKYTNSSGSATFTANIDETYQYNISLNGYQTKQGNIYITDDEEIVVTTTLLKYWTLQFEVKDRYTNLINDATVVIPNYGERTTVDGIATYLNSILTGNYSYNISKSKYNNTNGIVNVDKQDTYIEEVLWQWEVKFIIKDEHDNLLDGANVVITDYDSDVTDINGECILNVPTGNFAYVITKDGYRLDEGYVNVSDDTIKNITLLKYWNVTFIVKNRFEELIEGATIWIPTIGTAYTNEYGVAIFEGSILSGSYTYNIYHDQYNTFSGIVYVNAESVTVNVELITIQLTINVNDEAGVPINLATVNISGLSELETDEYGAIQIYIKSGIKTFAVSKSGYQTYNSSFHIVGDDLTLNVTLVKYLTLTFTIKDRYDNLLDDAKVTIPNLGSKYSLSGIVEYENLLPQPYSYTVELDNYDTSSDVATLQPMENKNVDITLMNYEVTFTVKDEDESLMDDVKVELYGFDDQYTVNGVVVFNVASGSYHYILSKDGYETETGTASVIGYDLSINRTLRLKHKLIVDVKDRYGNDIPSALISIFIPGQSDPFRTGTTDSLGISEIWLGSNNYTYTATKDNYDSYGGSITIDRSDDTLSVVLWQWEVTFNVFDESYNEIEGALIDAGVFGSETTSVSGVAVILMASGDNAYSISKELYWTENATVTVSGADVTVNKILQLTYLVTFYVKDQYDNWLKNVATKIHYFGDPNPCTITKNTNDDGIVTFELPSRDFTYYMQYGTTPYQNNFTVSNADLDIIVVLGSYYLTLEVLDDKYIPVHNALTTVEGFTSEYTDSFGKIIFLLPLGEHNISFEIAGFEDSFITYNLTQDIHVIVILRKYHRLRFIITDRHNVPIPGVFILVEAEDAETQSGYTNEYGILNLDNSVSTTYEYTISKYNYNTIIGTITLSYKGETVKHSLMYRYCKITLISDIDNSPIVGATLSIPGYCDVPIDNASEAYSLTTDENGEVTFTLPSGDHVCDIVDPSPNDEKHESQRVIIEVGDVDLNLIYTLRKLYKLNFNVTDREYMNLSAVDIVTSYNNPIDGVTSGSTDSNGNLTLYIPPDNYTFTASKFGYDTYNNSISMPAHQDTNVPSFILWNWYITLQVLDGSNNDVPLNEALVSVQHYPSQNQYSRFIDPDSGVTNFILPKGTHNLTIEKHQYTTASSTPSPIQRYIEPISVTGEDIFITRFLYWGDYYIIFTVKDRFGNPINGATIRLLWEGSHQYPGYSTYYTTNEIGVAIIENLYFRTYLYQITMPGYNRIWSSITVDQPENLVNITMWWWYACFRIRSDHDDSLLEGATVSAGANRVGITDENGYANVPFFLSSLQVGQYGYPRYYYYNVSKDGYETRYPTGYSTYKDLSFTIYNDITNCFELTLRKHYTVTFNIKDDSDNFIPGVVVTVWFGDRWYPYAKTLTTDGSNPLVFTGLVSRTYGYFISKYEYNKIYSTVTIDHNDIVIDITLKLHKVEFNIVDESSNPIYLTDINLIQRNSYGSIIYNQTNQTNISGYVVFDNLISSNQNYLRGYQYSSYGQIGRTYGYTYTISKSGYYSILGSIYLTDDVVRNHELRLLYTLTIYVKYDRDESSIDGAFIRITGDYIDPVSGTTSYGVIQLSLPSDSLHYILSKFGYDTVSDDFTISHANKTFTIYMYNWDINFHVKEDVNNTNLQGVNISIGGYGSKYTDVMGEAKHIVASGTHTATLSLSGYETQTYTFSFNKEHVNVPTIVLRKLYTAKFTVIDINDLPLNEIPIQLEYYDTVSEEWKSYGSGSTDINGIRIFQLPSQMYRYKIPESNYAEIIGTFEINHNTFEVTIVLKRWFNVSFNVKNEDNVPIDNAACMIGYHRCFTSGGSCSLSKIPEGNVRWRVQHTDYSSSSGSFILSDHISLNVVLTIRSDTIVNDRLVTKNVDYINWYIEDIGEIDDDIRITPTMTYTDTGDVDIYGVCIGEVLESYNNTETKFISALYNNNGYIYSVNGLNKYATTFKVFPTGEISLDTNFGEFDTSPTGITANDKFNVYVADENHLYKFTKKYSQLYKVEHIGLGKIVCHKDLIYSESGKIIRGIDATLVDTVVSDYFTPGNGISLDGNWLYTANGTTLSRMSLTNYTVGSSVILDTPVVDLDVNDEYLYVITDNTIVKLNKVDFSIIEELVTTEIGLVTPTAITSKFNTIICLDTSIEQSGLYIIDRNRFSKTQYIGYENINDMYNIGSDLYVLTDSKVRKLNGEDLSLVTEINVGGTSFTYKEGEVFLICNGSTIVKIVDFNTGNISDLSTTINTHYIAYIGNEVCDYILLQIRDNNWGNLYNLHNGVISSYFWGKLSMIRSDYDGNNTFYGIMFEYEDEGTWYKITDQVIYKNDIIEKYTAVSRDDHYWNIEFDNHVDISCMQTYPGRILVSEIGRNIVEYNVSLGTKYIYDIIDVKKVTKTDDLMWTYNTDGELCKYETGKFVVSPVNVGYSIRTKNMSVNNMFMEHGKPSKNIQPYLRTGDNIIRIREPDKYGVELVDIFVTTDLVDTDMMYEFVWKAGYYETYGTGVVHPNGKAYLFPGYNAYEKHIGIYDYTSPTSFTYIHPLSIADWNGRSLSCVGENNIIYIFSTNITNAVYKFDPTSNTLSSVNFTRNQIGYDSVTFRSCVSINESKIYLTTTSNVIAIYDITDDSIDFTTISVQNDGRGILLASNNKVYIAPRDRELGIYDIVTNTFTTFELDELANEHNWKNSVLVEDLDENLWIVHPEMICIYNIYSGKNVHIPTGDLLWDNRLDDNTGHLPYTYRILGATIGLNRAVYIVTTGSYDTNVWSIYEINSTGAIDGGLTEQNIHKIMINKVYDYDNLYANRLSFIGQLLLPNGDILVIPDVSHEFWVIRPQEYLTTYTEIKNINRSGFERYIWWS